jgi:hypothetical protein
MTLDTTVVDSLVRRVLLNQHQGAFQHLAGAFQFIGFAAVYLLVKKWGLIADFIMGRKGDDRKHTDDYRLPVNGARCPEVLSMVSTLPTVQASLSDVKESVVAIKEHEAGAIQLLAGMREDARKAEEHIEEVHGKLFDKLEKHGEAIAALNERTARDRQ